MTRAEIKRKFDEIVAFAEVEKFLDTPVKHYSSGMYVRLAFAVAAHLEPEILVVDEVLAVGDAQFQRKCLGKMEDVAKEGRTVLFVSHNMGMISSLCSKAILLERGNLILNGAVADGVSRYYNSGLSSPFSIDFIKNNRTIGDSFACLLEAHIEDTNGKHVGEIDIRSSFKVVMKYFIKEKVPFAPAPNLHFYNAQGGCAFATSNMEISFTNIGEYISVCKIPGNLLNNDTYFIDLGLTFTRPTTHTSFYERGALSFNIIDPIEETLEEMRFGFAGIIPGVVRPKLEWEIMKI
jgi:lipopolysaccharide transport system ATP-binding protein